MLFITFIYTPPIFPYSSAQRKRMFLLKAAGMSTPTRDEAMPLLRHPPRLRELRTKRPANELAGLLVLSISKTYKSKKSVFVKNLPIRVRYIERTSQSRSGSYAPSFASIITVPASSTSTVCHCPTGMLNAIIGPLGESSNTSPCFPSSS